jgi:hypothetical protein
MPDSVSDRYDQVSALADEIVARLGEEVERIGFGPQDLALSPPGAAVYRLERDPSNGTDTLVGDWCDERGARQGQLIFRDDGSFFVEHDVVLAHPLRQHWFVEAVNAWGRAGAIKVEARLLPTPE